MGEIKISEKMFGNKKYESFLNETTGSVSVYRTWWELSGNDGDVMPEFEIVETYSNIEEWQKSEYYQN